MSKEVSDERKGAYYLGSALMAIGGLLFFSVFVTGAMDFGNFDNFEEKTQSSGMRAIGGMALLFIGGIIRSIGARGLAGSGVILDPEQARSDLEPYIRMVGGMAKDAIDEADFDLGSKLENRPEQIVVIKCRDCGKLNEEDSKFCQECGQPI